MSISEGADHERARILGETAKIAWTELQRWFASGNAIYVSQELDLVETAYQLSLDNTAKFQEWMEVGRIDKVGDELAREWLAANALMWAVVVRPWVLVQPVVGEMTKPN
jgi:hypothetical protein